MTDRIDAFHAHLDECEQCREHPFDLCPLGGPLLESAASGLPPPTGRTPTYPRFQSMEPQTEFGKGLRDAIERSPFGAVLKALDFDYAEMERRMVHEFNREHDNHTTKKPGCVLCDMEK